MGVDGAHPEDVKRKLRKLKQMELKIRFPGGDAAHRELVWDRFFDLRGKGGASGKYTLAQMAVLGREAYRRVVEEYFARVYYELYRENGLTEKGAYDPELLSRLGLPAMAGAEDVKRRFRELARQTHPDAGGDAARFIELMEDYRKLTGR